MSKMTRWQRAVALLTAMLRWNRKHDRPVYAKRLRKARRDLLPVEQHVTPTPPTKPAHKPRKVGNLPASFIALVRIRQQSAHGPQFSGPDNGAGQCRLQCRLALGTASVGDFDGDTRADAEDAWKAAKHKHPGDRRPPRGYPVFWLGGSHDDGHEAISAGVPGSRLGNILRRLFGRETETWVWSTDIRRPGFFDMVPLAYIEQQWGLPYAGWAEDDDGTMIKELAA